MRLLLVTVSHSGLHGDDGVRGVRMWAGLLQLLFLIGENSLTVRHELVPVSCLDSPGIEWWWALSALLGLLLELLLLDDGVAGLL